MQDQTQLRRTLGVRDEYRTRAAALADEQRNFHLRQQRDGGTRRPAPAEQWSQPFETRALLVVVGPVPKDSTGRKLFCKHVRLNGEEIGALVARMPWGSELPGAGTRIEVAGLVSTCSNGRRAPLVRLQITRWEPK